MAGIAVALGALIAWVDSRPTWDDAGITAGLLLLVAAALGFADRARAWLWALTLGAWVPVFGIARHGNFGSLLALGFAFLGAYLGAFARGALRRLDSKRPGRLPPT